MALTVVTELLIFNGQRLVSKIPTQLTGWNQVGVLH